MRCPMTKLCTATFSLDNPSSIETYLAQDGYDSWKKSLEIKPQSQRLFV